MVDYSKWKKIEISDDEDDTHPNIDTPSLFRWRHQARQEREHKFQEECKALEERKKKLSSLSLDCEENMAKAEAERAEIEKMEKELERRAKLRPYNVDSIGKETWESTYINGYSDKAGAHSKKEYSDEEFQDFEKFIQTYEKDLKDYSFLHGVRGSRRFILEHANLVSQFTVDWLTMRCVDYKINGSIALLKHVAYQAVIIEMILDIAKSVGRGCDPRNCLSIFFDRYKDNTKLIDGVIEEQVKIFLERVDKGAEYRLERAFEKQIEDEEPILGPGGLDPNAVFQELDEELQDAFIDRDIEKLRKAMSKYSNEEAEKILQRCIDAGLWTNEVNPDLEEYAESFEKEQQRLAALKTELEPEPIAEAELSQIQDDNEEIEVRDVFSKLIINPNREIKKQPGLFPDEDEDDDKKDEECDDDGDKKSNNGNENASISDDYSSGGEDSSGDEKFTKNYKEYEFDLDHYEGRELNEEEQAIRDQLLELVQKNKKKTEKKNRKDGGGVGESDSEASTVRSETSEDSNSVE